MALTPEEKLIKHIRRIIRTEWTTLNQLSGQKRFDFIFDKLMELYDAYTFGDGREEWIALPRVEEHIWKELFEAEHRELLKERGIKKQKKEQQKKDKEGKIWVESLKMWKDKRPFNFEKPKEEMKK